MNDYIKSIYFKQYKSFSKDQFQEIKDIKKVNVIIGKNNTGKSSIIDIIKYSLTCEDYRNNSARFDKIRLGLKINEFFLQRYKVPKEHAIYKDIGKELVIELKPSQHGTTLFEYIIVKQAEQADYVFRQSIPRYIMSKEFLHFYRDYLRNIVFRRLNADRDINPEVEFDHEDLHEDGYGASNIIRKFILENEHKEEIIEKTLLDALNKIMRPEADFTNIKIQLLENNEGRQYEVFLSEKDTGRFALSQSGSGLKTIILILLNLWVIPETKQYENKKIVYAFEEIENNLHPALQRRLFGYLYDHAEKYNTCFFLTTHSHVAINTFFGKEEAQIYHVMKGDNGSSVETIDSLNNAQSLIEDLGVLPSDILQANGIIWVEGESDRIYLKKWIEIFSEKKLIEYQDYTIMFYGGSNLKHCTFSNECDENKINLLRLNKNALLIMDSDKSSEEDEIDRTQNYKIRIKDEFDKQGLTVWKTAGREIENYLPKEIIESVIDQQISEEFGKFKSIKKYYNDNVTDGSKFNKIKFAKKAIEFITYENSKDIFDLQEQISKLYKEIRQWNGQS